MNPELLKIAIRYEQDWALLPTSVVDFITQIEGDGWKIIEPGVSEGTPGEEAHTQ